MQKISSWRLQGTNGTSPENNHSSHHWWTNRGDSELCGRLADPNTWRICLGMVQEQAVMAEVVGRRRHLHFHPGPRVLQSWSCFMPQLLFFNSVVIPHSCRCICSCRRLSFLLYRYHGGTLEFYNAGRFWLRGLMPGKELTLQRLF